MAAKVADALPPYLQRKIRFVPALGADPQPHAVSYKQSGSKAVKSSTISSTEWSRVFPVGVGLNNVGNTCFLNSVLQCLAYTPPLHAALSKHACRDGVFCVQCEMGKLLRGMLNETKQSRPITPSGIVGRLKSIAKHFRIGRQEDSHEFLRFLLEAMQKREGTMVNDLFGGLLESTVKCQQCGHVSRCRDPMLDLSLDISQVANVEAAIRQFCQPEKLSQSARYRCEGCGQTVAAAKQFHLHHLPACLTIHLKRFSVDLLTGYPVKVNREVGFSEQMQLADSTGLHLYRLYALIVHEGSGCNVGHYHAFVRAPNDLWYSMNDDQVMQVSLSTVLRQKAYLLFYRRTGQGDDRLREPSPVPSLSSSSCEPSKKKMRLDPQIPEASLPIRLVPQSTSPPLVPASPPPPPHHETTPTSTSMWRTFTISKNDLASVSRMPRSPTARTWRVKRCK